MGSGQYSVGRRKEIEFSKFFRDVVFADKEQDMNEHWDVCVRYDVKMVKRKNRSGDYDENIHWIEIKNVNGDKGWIYGEADFISFELEDYWVVVRRTDLIDFVHDKCKDKKYCTKPELYKLYSRNGRKDLITLVKSIDLMYIAYEIFKK